MSGGKINMIEAKEILYRYKQGLGKREIASSLNISRNTVKNIIKEAEELGFSKDKPDSELTIIYDKLNDFRQKKSLKKCSTTELLVPYREEIEKWLQVPNCQISSDLTHPFFIMIDPFRINLQFFIQH